MQTDRACLRDGAGLGEKEGFTELCLAREDRLGEAGEPLYGRFFGLRVLPAVVTCLQPCDETVLQGSQARDLRVGDLY